MKEIWKPVFGFENYQISNFGRVKTLNYYNTGQEKILKQGLQRYVTVNLRKDGKFQCKLVHRLVYEAFHGHIPPNMQINHKDENKYNNCLSNLEICTPKYNNTYGTRLKRVSEKLLNRVDHSKAIVCYDKQGNFVKEFLSEHEAQRWLNIEKAQSHISHCLNNKCKSAYGFVWKYKE